MDVLAGDNVLAIFLTGPKSPALTLQGKGLTGKGEMLRVGMTDQEAAGVLKGQLMEAGRLRCGERLSTVNGPVTRTMFLSS